MTNMEWLVAGAIFILIVLIAMGTICDSKNQIVQKKPSSKISESWNSDK